MLIEVGSSALDVPTGARFQVVAGEPEDASKLAGILSEMGHSVTTATGADQALRMLAENHPDIVFLFEPMPGHDTAALVRSLTETHDRHLCVAVGRPSECSHIIGLFHAGLTRYLERPVTPDKVEMCVSHLISRLIQDRTRRAMELELAKSQEQLQEMSEELEASNQELERFAYVVSHDLQEPLRNVASYVQLLQKRYGEELDEDAHEFIEFAAGGARRMRRLIDGLLQYSRVSTRGQEKRPTDMEAVMREVEHDLEPRIIQADATVTSGELPTVPADPMQMRRLLQNLLGNALKFRGDATPRVRVRAHAEEDAWHFVVEDNGIGIPPDQLEDVFNIYRRLHTQSEYEGTGIGLAICKRIVERHGGEIWAESSGEGGTAFHFTLPAVA